MTEEEMMENTGKYDDQRVCLELRACGREGARQSREVEVRAVQKPSKS